MTVKHWNTGQSAARFRLQASSDKQEERLSPAALKIHEAWCRDNGYKPQANFKKKPQASFNKKPQAPRYKSSDYAARRAASK